MDVLLDKMSEGSSIARNYILEILREMRPHGIDYILKLDSHNIRGEQLEILSKQYAAKDLCHRIELKDQSVIDYLNNIYFYEGQNPHKARFF